MNKADLTAVIDGTTPMTRALCRALANTLVNVIDAASTDSAHLASQGEGHPFQFGYKTACRVLAAVIDETDFSASSTAPLEVSSPNRQSQHAPHAEA